MLAQSIIFVSVSRNQYNLYITTCKYYCSYLLFFFNTCHILDTEGSFIVERVVDIAEAAIKHMTHIIQSSDVDETGQHSLHFLSNLTVFAVNHNFAMV